MEGIRLEFTQEAKEYVAEKALEFKLGARGLRSICEAILTEAMFELPSQKDVFEFIVDDKYAKERLNESSLSLLKVA